jgi:FtsH-binding integral membrane protein
MNNFKLPKEIKLCFWPLIVSIIVLTLAIGINIECFSSGNGSAFKVVISVVEVIIVTLDIALLRKNLKVTYDQGVLDGREHEPIVQYVCVKSEDAET